MLYLSEKNIETIGVDWTRITHTITESINVMSQGDYAQPIKPYLRYGDPKNRIIAMPAYRGGSEAMAGIKWIASFPDNRNKGIDRAHAMMVLNDPDTGIPVSVISAGQISAIRTAGVSGIVIREYLNAKEGSQKNKKYSFGIIGLGPIGRLHADMICSMFEDQIEDIYFFDSGEIDESKIKPSTKTRLKISSSWQEVYDRSDIFITCTVSKNGYIDRAPKVGSLHLNVSLRDYKPEMMNKVDMIVVDDWDECCRENTDIETMHIKYGLKKENTKSIIDIVCHKSFEDLEPDQVAMFNPMGMAIFDIGVATYYLKVGKKMSIGVELEK